MKIFDFILLYFHLIRNRGKKKPEIPPKRGLRLSLFGCLARIILGLGVPEFLVFPAGLRQQLFVGPLLDDGACVKYGDLVAEFAAGQPVADVDGGFVRGDVVETCRKSPPPRLGPGPP